MRTWNRDRRCWAHGPLGRFHSCQQLKRPIFWPILALEKGQGTSHRPQALAGCGRSAYPLRPLAGCCARRSRLLEQRRGAAVLQLQADRPASWDPSSSSIPLLCVGARSRPAVGGGQRAASRAQPRRASRWKGKEVKKLEPRPVMCLPRRGGRQLQIQLHWARSGIRN